MRRYGGKRTDIKYIAEVVVPYNDIKWYIVKKDISLTQVAAPTIAYMMLREQNPHMDGIDFPCYDFNSDLKTFDVTLYFRSTEDEEQDALFVMSLNT